MLRASVSSLRFEELRARAAAALGMSGSMLHARLAAMGKEAGKPWGSEQRECALAGWMAAAAS
jgi:hypothetical protein